MTITTLPLGDIGTNCYLVADDGKIAAVIDPGDQAPLVLRQIRDQGLTVKTIFLTHGHYDHTTAVHDLVEALGPVAIYIHKADTYTDEKHKDHFRYLPQDGCNYYEDGDTVTVGALDFHVLHTPGHSAGSVTLQCEDVLFTGDTLFKGSMGRTDLQGGGYDAIMTSLKRLGSLPGDYKVCPGHMEASTLSAERASNYYLKEAMGTK